jgi:hypothetical protein
LFVLIKELLVGSTLAQFVLLFYWFRSIQMMDIGSPILDMTSLPSRLWLVEEFLLQLADKLVLERSQVCCVLSVNSLFW